MYWRDGVYFDVQNFKEPFDLKLSQRLLVVCHTHRFLQDTSKVMWN